MNFLNRQLTKTGSKIFTQKLLSRPLGNTSSLIIPRNNIATSKKLVSHGNVRYYIYGAAGGILIGTGTTLAYAKYDPHFRKSLKACSETMDSAINIIWQEDQTFLEYLKELTGMSRTDTDVATED